MTMRRLTFLVAFLSPSLAAPVLIGFAQESPTAQPAAIAWRTNYNQARKEAEEKNLPLMIDFYMFNCPPCEVLERTTFRDPKIVELLKDRCIPVKINGEVETMLRDHLRITSYPTLVLASSDGKILSTLVGGTEVSTMLLSSLERIVPAAQVAATPQSPTVAPTQPAASPMPDLSTRDYQLAATLAQKGEYARSVLLLRTIIDEAKGKPVQAEAQKLLTELSQKADAEVGRAKQLQAKGQPVEAVAVLTETMHLFPGLPAAKEAATLLTQAVQSPEQRNGQRAKRAQELLAQARDFHKNREYIPCLDRCEILLASYGDLQEGQEASILTLEIKNNPEWLQNACDTMSDRLGSLYLSLSDSLLKKGDRQRAEFYLQRVIQAFPGSRQAESAQIRLAQIRGVPATRIQPGDIARP